MITNEQCERLLGQLVAGVELESAVEELGISAHDLQMRLLCDEAFDVSLALAQGMQSEFATALFKELVANQGRDGHAPSPKGALSVLGPCVRTCLVPSLVALSGSRTTCSLATSPRSASSS